MKVALLGNPNTGKTSVFNSLTGLRQNVGNFPGVTVDRKAGKLKIDDQECTLIDFPGTYSIYPRSKDEKVVYECLSQPDNEDYPDVVAVVIDKANLERNLLFFTQVYDLKLPTVMILNMTDLANRKEIKYDVDGLRQFFPEAIIVESNARIKSGKHQIEQAIINAPKRNKHRFIGNAYLSKPDDLENQERETEIRFFKIRELLSTIRVVSEKKTTRSEKLDRILIHPVFGYLIFAVILLIIFQFIFSFSTIPMDWIDSGFGMLSAWTESLMPSGIFTDLLTQGIIPGIGGVIIFIPQIALLFFFIGVLEETGYLSRVVFIMDRIMRPLGLNGKSVVPMMSSVACAIPGVMAARSISDWKERMITILVVPLMSCSARIPVYTLLIAVVIPDKTIGGVFGLQGLVLFGLYMLGAVGALLVALLLKMIIKTQEKGFHLLEMPSYKSPRWGNVGLSVIEKVRVFVWDAGKVILAISIILWVLATYGPGEKMSKASAHAQEKAIELKLNEQESNRFVASAKLENSYIGIMGKVIEPVIKPIGYDWKIGISLITSFAAREVFVGSMATIYSIHDDGDKNIKLREKMKAAKNSDGMPIYTIATGMSLMVFYAFAMQCMATLAVVKRETKSWKWPLIQVGYMGVLAYLGAFITFIALS